METVYIKHSQFNLLQQAVMGILTSKKNIEEGINGLTDYRLNKIRKDIEKEREDFNNFFNKLLDETVKGGHEEPKTKGDKYVFIDDEAEEKYTSQMETYMPLSLRTLLDEKDLQEFSTNIFQIENIECILRSDALFKNPDEEEEKSEKEEKETTKKKK